MDDSYGLSWHDGGPGLSVASREEVICGIDNGCAIMPTSEETYGCQEVVVREHGAGSEEEEVEEEDEDDGGAETIVPDENQGNGGLVYLSSADGVNVLVMQEAPAYMECQVTEEVITDDWANSHGGSEHVEVSVGEVGAEQQIDGEESDVPLPTDQDEYTASRPYPCDFCSRRFRKKANLMNHMVAHQTDRPHGCNLCGARYIRKCDLMNHLKIHAYVPEPDEMDERDREQEREREREQRERDRDEREELGRRKAANRRRAVGKAAGDRPKVKIEAEEPEPDEDESDAAAAAAMETDVYPVLDPRKPFVCQHCGVAFAREKALASHARIHGGDSPFECDTCGEMFWDLALLGEHVRVRHGAPFGVDDDGGIDENDDDDDDDYVDEDDSYGDYYCGECGVRFHRQDLLRRHARQHELGGVKEEFQGDHHHVCNVCGQTFGEPLDLLAHAEVHARHAANAGHRCLLCGEAFADEETMGQHVAARHAKSMPANSCMLCGKTCKDRRTLLKHSWDHSREKLFSCSKCGKSFHNKARLKRHMVSHRNKAVQCDVCGEDFPDGRSLMNHRHSHSNISGRQFPCRECGKTFGSRSSQQIHIRIHTGERPYGCRFCWKAFADGGTLRKHERIHTGEKPYACAVCPRAFNQRVVLREHIRSHHSGPDPAYVHTVTPYCCSVCNDMFSASQDLILHLIHHCDLNTALKRQPQLGPRKYKRRRKLKPHELDLLSQSVRGGSDDESPLPAAPPSRPKRRKGGGGGGPVTPPVDRDYETVFQSFESAVTASSTGTGTGNKKKTGGAARPKMIHTQKARAEDGRNRHRTRTTVTTRSERERERERDRVRPRTKNVSYHSLLPDKPPLARFELDEPTTTTTTTTTVTEEIEIKQERLPQLRFDETDEVPDVAGEETVVAAESLTPGRLIIGPGNKVVRVLKRGVVVKREPEPSPLHELAELSMQHASNLFRCEMCSATFNDRSQLLMHVPIHI